MKLPTKLKKMKLKSVDFVRRGANPEADIALYKSYDHTPEENEIDVAKAEQDLTMFTDTLGESFSSIMKDDSLNQEERVNMIAKSMNEFTDTLDGYLSSFSILEKSEGDPEDDSTTTVVTQKSSKLSKGDNETMANYMNVDKSLLTPDEASQLDALLAKACKTKKADEEDPVFEMEKECGGKSGCKMQKECGGKPGCKTQKVDPSQAQEEEMDNMPPAVKKALADMEEMKKSYEMRELENIAKKYEVLGKKASDEAKVLYDLKKSGESNYNAYIAVLDEQVGLVEKSGLFSEIGKSGSFNYTPVAKSEPETKIEAIAKGYQEKDPNMSYADAVAKAWENNPELFAAYEQSAGF